MLTVELTQLEAELICDCLRNRRASISGNNTPNSVKQEVAVITALLSKLDYPDATLNMARNALVK